jgi:hypothetical protein
MRDHEISAPTVLERKPWNKGKPIAAASAKARLVDPDQAAGRGANARLGNVQFGYR